MDSLSDFEDRFVVFVQDEGQVGSAGECEVARCRSYEEAKTIRREVGWRPHKCVIRYFGPAGGGD